MSSTASGRASRRLPQINSTTRAIRAALLASTAALAFAGAPAAFAGTCTETAPLEVTCTGVFTDTVNNSFPPGSEVPDLTLILEDDATVTTATGVVGLDASWGGDVTVLNYGDFTSDSADAIYQYGSDTATLNTYGDISTYVGAIGANAIDISALNDVNLVIGGYVSAYSDAGYDVLTVSASSAAGNTNVLVDGTGVVTASAYDGNAVALYADAFDGVDVTVDGSIYAVSAYGAANGVVSLANLGDSSVNNYGSIGADGYTAATAVAAVSKYSNVAVNNSGDIYAVADADNGIGVIAYAAGDVYLGNSGTVSAESGYGSAVGMAGYAIGGNATIYNAGSIYASGYDVAAGAGVLAATGEAFASNYGDIDAVAYGYATATANGLLVAGYAGATAYNAGSVSASAYADAVLGDAYATGIDVLAGPGATAYVTLGADSVVSAYATGYLAQASGVLVDADTVYFGNEGSIDAAAVGENGFASGVSLYGANGFTADNSGDISASFSGAGGSAYGLYAISTLGEINVYNSGTISASADYFAAGVTIATDTYGLIYNTGTIEGSDAEQNVAIWSQGLSADTIENYGTITGAVWAGDGDDYLYNADGATWNVGQTPSYFGAGDDTIVNHGTINMDDSTIDLGYHSVDGNAFFNYGTITLEGDNTINMGSGLPLLPSINPNPFYNDGVLDFQDGAPDDTLTIIGDFAGDGEISVDVSGLNGTSDLLYIEGSVAADSVNAINVDLLDMSQDFDELVPIVYVTGTSVDGNFVLGDINWDPNDSFVNLEFDIVSDIDATNATSDVFSLGIEATGLSDPGTLAASIAPSVHSLMNSQVGTWRQRMGVIDSFNKGGISLWARVFHDKGSFNPGYSSDNFGTGGNYAWDQKNSGVEGGIDFAVTDEFSIGLLAAKSKAEMSLNPGNAHSELDANTWGVYGTWISPSGFYLDTSYRWTKFDLDLNSVAGPMQAGGDAETFNIEGGYAFTLSGGLKIEPQLQYTKTTVDNIDLLTTDSGMSFRNDGGESSRGRAGVAVRKSFGDADTGWEITPHVTLSAVREFEGESNYAINDSLFGRTTVKGTSTLLELGVNARRENLAVYAGLNWQDGGAMNSFIGGQVGMRYTFGGASPAPAPVAVVAPAPVQTCADLDDDGDGVNNCNDRCVGSTTGQVVGSDGCPVPVPEPEPVMEPKPYRG